MTHHPGQGDPAELAALYLAGAMPPDEHLAFESHLDGGCGECLDKIRALGRVVDLLALGIRPIAPEPSTRARLLAGIGARPTPSAGSSRAVPGREATVRRAARARWRPSSIAGIAVRLLRADRDQDRLTAMVRMDAGTTIPAHDHHGPEELFILEGDLRSGDDVLVAGDYLHSPPGSRHDDATSDRGCVALIVMPMAATGGILAETGTDG